MALSFASLGSGSKGNATLVKSANTCVLIDCGFSTTEVDKRIAKLGMGAESLSAILVTHEHKDHIGGVARLARKYRIPVYLTSGTYRATQQLTKPENFGSKQHLIGPDEQFTIGDISIQAYTVPHDAREPCQYRLSVSDKHLGVLSDVGHITPHITQTLAECDALMLEANHDTNMLAHGPYPQHLKHRVGGPYGHLSNTQAAGLLAKINVARLQHLVAGHLSEQNNCADIVRELFVTALIENMANNPQRVKIAGQGDGFDWLAVE